MAPPEIILDRPVPKYSTSGRFKQTLKQTFTFRWRRVVLREILTTFSDEYEISILLDRRIDPDQLTQGTLKDIPLQQGIESIAKQAKARVQVVANTLYIVPLSSVGNIEATIRNRKGELLALLKNKQFPRLRRSKLTRRNTIHWNDLDTPREIVTKITKRYGLKVNGLDQIPHDLWATATLPDISCYEALSLVLNQYDLTFKWSDNASAIEIVPLTK